MKGQQRGVSIIELMISITIGMILIAGITTIYTRIGAAGSENISRTRLNQQLRATMDYMTRDLMKASYVNSWTSGAANASGVNTTVIEQFGDVTVGGTCSSGKCSCILYSYDINSDGEMGVGSSGTAVGNQNTDSYELLGIRLSDGKVQTRYAGTTHTCAATHWSSLTDDEVKITALTFELDSADTVEYYVAGGSVVPSTCRSSETCLERRKVNIVLTGELASDSSINATMKQQVAIKNDYMFTK
jgi:type II secretory pathway component PulJ